MKKYVCVNNCGYSTNLKSDLSRHYGRKKNCVLPQSASRQIQIIEDNNIEDYRAFIEDMTQQIKIKDKELKIKDNQIKIKDEQIKTKDEQIQSLIKKVGNINSNNTTNINVLLSFKETKTNHLTDEDFLKCINKCIMAVPSLIEKIHFNKEIPENHNIYINNLRRNDYIMMYDGVKWVIKKSDEIIEDMIRDNDIRLEDWVNSEEIQKRYPKAMKKFEEYLDKKEENGVYEKIKDEIKLQLYNNRQLCKNKNIELVTVD